MTFDVRHHFSGGTVVNGSRLSTCRGCGVLRVELLVLELGPWEPVHFIRRLAPLDEVEELSDRNARVTSVEPR